MNLDNHIKLHEKALQIAGKYLHFEAQLISVLQELDRDKTYIHFQMTSLCAYAVKYLQLSESVALTLIAIARKSMQVPDLKAAIEQKKISVSNARRIAPILNLQNKTEWLEKASSLPLAKLEQALAKSFPQERAPTKIRYKSESNARLEVDLPLCTLEKLRRVQEILSQKKKVHCKEADALEAVLGEFIERHDPLVKAERAVAKTKTLQKPMQASDTGLPLNGFQQRLVETASIMKKLPVARPVVGASEVLVGRASEQVLRLSTEAQSSLHKSTEWRRAALPAATKHQLALRDQGQCTHRYTNGARCAARQWLHVHHIQEVARGGSDELLNLTTLCSAHHKIRHLVHKH